MISIVVPVYNTGKYVEKCLESIVSQSFSDFEVICVDDGSTDDSMHICKKWESKDSRIHVVSQANKGVSAARNKALEMLRGKYVCFVDSDDMVSHDYLSHLNELSKDGSFPICDYTLDVCELGKGKNSAKNYESHEFIRLILKEKIKHPNLWEMMFKTSIIRDNDIWFTEGCIKNEDTEFYIKYLVYEQKVVVSQRKNYYYRPNPSSVMRTPATIKSLTSIEASKRINSFLVEKDIISNKSIVQSNCILKYAYSLSKSRDKELYDYLHSHYDVNMAMKDMSVFPRLSKRIVAKLYLISGRKFFFNFVGLSFFVKLFFSSVKTKNSR